MLMRKLSNPFISDVAKNDAKKLALAKTLTQAGIDVLLTGCEGQNRAMFKKDGKLIGMAYLRGNLHQLDLNVGPTRQANISVFETSKL